MKQISCHKADISVKLTWYGVVVYQDSDISVSSYSYLIRREEIKSPNGGYTAS